MEDKYYAQIKEKVIDTETTIRVKDYSIIWFDVVLRVDRILLRIMEMSCGAFRGTLRSIRREFEVDAQGVW